MVMNIFFLMAMVLNIPKYSMEQKRHHFGGKCVGARHYHNASLKIFQNGNNFFYGQSLVLKN